LRIGHLTEQRYYHTTMADRPAQKLGSGKTDVSGEEVLASLTVEQLDGLKELLFGEGSDKFPDVNWDALAAYINRE
jgi:hypothetical protein